MRKKSYKIIMICIFLFMMAILLLLLKKNPVIEVNGKKIYENEFSFLTKISRGNSEKNEQERVIAAKCEQQLLRQYGVIDDISYKGFLKELADVNRERKEILQQGGKIYGPSEYSAKVYYDYKYSEAKEELLQKKLMSEVSDEEILQYKNENGDFHEINQIRYQIAHRKYDAMLNEMFNQSLINE